MDRDRLRFSLRRAGLLALLSLVSACVTLTSAERESWEAQLTGNNIVLLGEVHDHAGLHKRRVEGLRRAVEAGWRPVIAMEQFDTDRQVDLNRARLERPRDVDYLIDRAGGPPGAWTWTFYRPIIALAMEYDLPLVAANLARTTASQLVTRDYQSVLGTDRARSLGLAAQFDPQWLAAQTREIEQGHCNSLPAAILPGMTRAQLARDAVMAEVLRSDPRRGVVLLAGNGHVRRDLGVPRWLTELPTKRVWSVGFLEKADQALGSGAFDLVALATASDASGRTAEVDPCTQFRVRTRRAIASLTMPGPAH